MAFDQNAIQDDNRFPALIAHSGTAGTSTPIRLVATADGALTVSGGAGGGGTVVNVNNIVGGTIGSILGIGGTVQVSGASAGTNVNIVSGSQETLGTVGTINGIGSITNIGSISNIGTMPASTLAMNSGTITTIQAGTQQTLGTVGTVNGVGTMGGLGVVTSVTNLVSGTLLNSGTTTGVGVVTTVTNLTSGSVRMTVGTITTGSITTVASVLSITAGTQNTLGTVGVVNNVAGGTLRVDKTPTQIGTPLHVRGTTGAAVWGTLVAASGAGTRQYVSGVDIVVVSGTVDVAITSIGVGGSTGAGVLARGQFAPSTGITKSFDPIHASGTNGTLAYWLGGAGTVDMIVNYWNGV